MMDVESSENIDNNVTAMLNRLSLIGEEQLRKGNLRKAKTAFEYALKKSRIAHDLSYIESSLVNLAATSLADEKPEQVLEYLQAALDLEYENVKNGDIRFNMALAREQLGCHGEAVKEYELAITAYQTENATPDILVRTCVKAGILLMKLGRYRKSAQYLDMAATILSEKELLEQLATVLCMKAKCLVSSDKTVTEAIDVCEECVKLCNSISTQDSFTVSLYNELGLLLTQCKQYEKSAECYKLALDASDQSMDDILPITKRAALLQNLGAVLNSTKNFQDAANYSEQAADIYGSHGVRSSQCHCFLNMAYSYAQMKTDSAMQRCDESYLHALQAAKDTDCQRDQWQSLEGLAGVALYRGDLGRAVSCYQKAIGICAAVGKDTKEQEGLVRKLSAVLRSRAQRNGGNGVHHSQPGHTGQHETMAAWNQQQQSATQYSSVWSQAVLSEPSVSAAVAASVAAADQVSPDIAQYIMSQPVYVVSPQGDSTPSITPLPTDHRPVNPHASRQTIPTTPVQFSEAYANNPQHLLDVLQESKAGTSHVVRRKNAKEIKKLSHRRQSNLHPVHGRPEILVKGLGTYRKEEDNSEHLSPQHIKRKGRRRRRTSEGSFNSERSDGLYIKGLAVTLDQEPMEPHVGFSPGHHYDVIDEVDGPNTISVRPMSRQVQHRQSAIHRYGRHSDRSDTSSSSSSSDDGRNLAELKEDNTIDYYNCTETSTETSTDAEEVYQHQKRLLTLQTTSEMGGTAKRSSDESSDEQTLRAAVKKDRNGAAENPEYGSIVKEKRSEWDKLKSSTNQSIGKGKRPMTGKLKPRKFSKVNVKKENVGTSSSDDEAAGLGGRKDSLLLLDNSIGDSDTADHHAMKEHMRRITSLDTSSSSGEEEKDSNKNKANRDKTTSSENSEDRDLNVSDPEGAVPFSTYMNPGDGSGHDVVDAGGAKSNESDIGANFFQNKVKKVVQIDPDYETIPAAGDTAPVSNAPPKLPARNYSKSGKGSEGSETETQSDAGSTDSEESKDLSAMTRGEREKYLYQKQQQADVRGNEESKRLQNQAAEGRSSKMCSVM